MNQPLLTQKLTWSQILEIFDGEWVELVDYRWDWDRAHPGVARVRNHASDRKTLLKAIKNSADLDDTVVMFVSGSRTVMRSVIHFAPSHAAL